MNVLTMTLQPSGRIVKAKMMKDDTPIGDADLKVQTSTGAVLHFKSDPTGNVQIGLLPDERIESLTGWTNQPLFGGFQFDREPVRDEKADTQTIELFACRDQKFRVVDGQGNPCGNVEIFLHVATPPPNYNYLGNIEASRMVTNKDGEANFRWFPDWKDIHCYVDLKSDQWVIDGRARWSMAISLFRSSSEQCAEEFGEGSSGTKDPRRATTFLGGAFKRNRRTAAISSAA